MDTDWRSRTKYSEGGSQDSRQVWPPWKGWSSNYTKGAERIRHYRPEILVQEDCAGHRSRRCPRIQRLLDQVRAFRWSKCTGSYFGAGTKHEIAQAIAGQLPELAQHLPRFRKPWMSEDYRMEQTFVGRNRNAALLCVFTNEIKALAKRSRLEVMT